MATLIIDTHNFITRLKEAGMEEKQAEAIVDGIRSINLENVASKADLIKLKSDLLMWLIPLLLGQIAVFAMVVKFLIEP
jgi:hypothetical protein